MKFLMHLGLISWIFFVGIFDSIITYLTRSTILVSEKNPISLLIITTLGLTFFISIKIVLTLAIVVLLACMASESKYNIRIPKRVTIYIDIIIVSIFIFQMWLFCYLNWSGEKPLSFDTDVWTMFTRFLKDIIR